MAGAAHSDEIEAFVLDGVPAHLRGTSMLSLGGRSNGNIDSNPEDIMGYKSGVPANSALHLAVPLAFFDSG